MKIIFYSKESWEEQYVTAKLAGQEVVFRSGGSIADTSAPDLSVDAISVFVDSPVTKAVLDRFPNLKLIATRSTGYDHIDIAEAKARGVAVATVPGYGAPTVAEFVFALLLALSRKVVDAKERVSQGHSFAQDNLRGFDLCSKTIGIVGTGRIGAHAARIAHGFGMKVLATDEHQNASLVSDYGATYVSLPELLAGSDIISLHVPYLPSTHHLINAAAFAQIKKGAYIINTARGAVIDTDALLRALDDGTIAGAGLDVLEEEGMMDDELQLLGTAHPKEDELRTLLENHALLAHPRVIITPHVAFNTDEAVHRILDTTIDSLQSFADGTPKNTII